MSEAAIRGLIQNVMRIRKQWRNSLEASIRASGLSSNPPLGDERILINYLFNKLFITRRIILMSDLTASQDSQRMTMKDSIIALLVTKVNLSQEKAEQVFEIAMTYIKDHPHQLLIYINNLRTGNPTAKLKNFFT